MICTIEVVCGKCPPKSELMNIMDCYVAEKEPYIISLIDIVGLQTAFSTWTEEENELKRKLSAIKKEYSDKYNPFILF